jgi:hypothetical protein
MQNDDIAKRTRVGWVPDNIRIAIDAAIASLFNTAGAGEVIITKSVDSDGKASVAVEVNKPT